MIEHGASSLGLMMTEFPAARAGASFFTAMKRGWLNGCDLRKNALRMNTKGSAYSDLGHHPKRNALNVIQKGAVSWCNKRLIGSEERCIVDPDDCHHLFATRGTTLTAIQVLGKAGISFPEWVGQSA